jgi:hypothetical protein
MEDLELLALQKLEGNAPTATPGGDENELAALRAQGIVDQPAVQVEPPAEPEPPAQVDVDVDPDDEPEVPETNEDGNQNVNADENPEKDLNFDIDLDEGKEIPVTDDFVTKYQSEFETLGLSDVKDSSEFVEKFKQLKQELEETKESTKTVFANDMIREANEIMKQGGDWLGYLGLASFDYDGVPDVELLSYELKSDFDSKEELDDYLASLDETQIRLNAKRIRKDLKLQQDAQKQQIAIKAEQSQRAYDENLKTSNQGCWACRSRQGQRPRPGEHRKDAYHLQRQRPKATEFQIKHFLKPSGEPDFQKMVQSAYKLEMFDKVLEYATRSAKNSGKAAVIQNLSNVDRPKTTNIAEVTPRKALSLVESEVDRLRKGEKPLF